MNYLYEILAFYDLLHSNKLSTGQIALWHALMHINNKARWAEWFTAPNLTLELLTGLSRQAIIKNRNALKQIGLIDFKSNGTSSASFRIKILYSSTDSSTNSGTDGGTDGGTESGLLTRQRQRLRQDKDKDYKKEKDKREKVPPSDP